jgi:hypothetical protein
MSVALFIKIGPTNRSSLLDSSPFSETANANLLNPKSPSNDLKNRATIRLPNRNNTNTSFSSSSFSSSSSSSSSVQSTSNLNNVNSNPNNLLISQSSNSSQLARNSNTTTTTTTSNSRSLTKNTSPPVIPTAHKPPKQQMPAQMHSSASFPTLPIKPTKKPDNFADVFKIFKVTKNIL